MFPKSLYWSFFKHKHLRFGFSGTLHQLQSCGWFRAIHLFKYNSVKLIHLCQYRTSQFCVSLYSYVCFIKRKIKKPRLRLFYFSLSQKLYLLPPAIVSTLLSSAMLLTWGEVPVPGEDGFSSLITYLPYQGLAATLLTLQVGFFKTVSPGCVLVICLSHRV